MESRKGRSLEVVQRQARLSSGGKLGQLPPQRRTDRHLARETTPHLYTHTN